MQAQKLLVPRGPVTWPDSFPFVGRIRRQMRYATNAMSGWVDTSEGELLEGLVGDPVMRAQPLDTDAPRREA